MAIDWNMIFDSYGIKTVTDTDKRKAAYVVNEQQLLAVEAAGVTPIKGEQFQVAVLLGDRDSVNASFYFSTRNPDERTPEPRMGGKFISSWLAPGDNVILGNVGKQLFAAKLPAEEPEAVEVAQAVIRAASRESKEALIERAKLATGRPERKVVERNEFTRSIAVVAGALARAAGACEMPGCRSQLFERDDGTAYLEVHHIVPLAEDGEDTLTNAAGLCPSCHRRLHHGKDRQELRALIKSHINGM
ncbi:HNH endonuclease [Dyella silvae]|uniref:HNH endonuclease n=1 Tax=Dyella silvae TaxID=2994424 RepID=UPI002263E441|nr:HNH endonuclease signature motif containing protein [Dyella silvae]